MEIKQVYQFVNDAVSEVIGDTAIVAEDLSNAVDVGTAIFNASAFDAYVKSLVNHIGKVIFVALPPLFSWMRGNMVLSSKRFIPRCPKRSRTSLGISSTVSPTTLTCSISLWWKPSSSIR